MTTLAYRVVLNEKEMDAVWEGIGLYLSKHKEKWKEEKDEFKKMQLSEQLKMVGDLRLRLRRDWFKASYTVFPKDTKEPKGFT